MVFLSKMIKNKDNLRFLLKIIINSVAKLHHKKTYKNIGFL